MRASFSLWRYSARFCKTLHKLCQVKLRGFTKQEKPPEKLSGGFGQFIRSHMASRLDAHLLTRHFADHREFVQLAPIGGHARKDMENQTDDPHSERHKEQKTE